LYANIGTTYDGTTAANVEIALEPKHAPVDHIFRYYEPEHSYFKVSIPPFLQLTSPELHAKLSKESAQVHIDHKTSEIHVSSKTSDALNEVCMTVFVYADVFMSKLLASVRVEVTPLNCMYSQTRAGVQNKMNLAFPTGDCKQVEIHSSNYKNAYLPKRSANNTFNMLSNTINHVPICTKTYTTAQ
jgi:hypothetical protein